MEIDPKDPSDVAKVLRDFANQFGLGSKAKKLAEEIVSDKTHRALQQSLFDIFAVVIKEWADSKAVDGRNVRAVRMSKEIKEQFFAGKEYL